MNRAQGIHETLIPLLVQAVGARSYLEFGTHANETIDKVTCEKRYGVDVKPIPSGDILIFQMSTQRFIAEEAASLAPFDVCFIDADHDEDAVWADFHGIWPHISTDGLVLLHDTQPATHADTDHGLCSTAWKAARRIHEAGFHCVTLPYHPGLTIVRKQVAWGPADA